MMRIHCKARDMGLARNKLTPFLTFHGNAEEAMNFYAEILPGAKIEALTRFTAEQRGDTGKVLTGILSFAQQQIMFMDMEAAVDCPRFTWATSFYLNCNDEAEFAAVFDGLARDGVVLMQAEQFMQFRRVAWVTDKFGVTWQTILE
jgi:predicted 3-demethylubiquinone-9 3-methyltransferase (glyoxalase superfamily)